MTVVKQLANWEQLTQGAYQAKHMGQSILVSHTQRIDSWDPLSFFAKAGTLFQGKRSFWSDASQGMVLVGVGETLVFDEKGSAKEHRFAAVERKWQEWVAHAIMTEGHGPGTGPVIIGGFSFDPNKKRTDLWKGYQEASLIVPRWLLTINESGHWLTVNIVLEPDEDLTQLKEQLNYERQLLEEAVERNSFSKGTPFVTEEVAPDAWKQSIVLATREIQKGTLKKVVLARELRLTGERNFSPEGTLASLHANQPDSYLFAIERGDGCFVGASPERLVKREGRKLLSNCIAGSIGRGVGIAEDIALGEELLQDQKNREEHDFVVQMIREAFCQESEDVDVPEEPILHKLRYIQHLFTPVTGWAREGTSLLSMVHRLHPTPALGGWPWSESLSWIREQEVLDRGWYAAPIGWMDAKGDGEFCVAIRSGLLRGKQASLFAGCGVVEESDPEKEYEETRWKFRPMLSALDH
ncbi:isochorismate synthase [Marininema halotolerans]|uniref:isochorismate synthase n=1 Tax=Marininema halotolerans TaxID=1155944 RepID=A0A1I6TZ62_9BACL|nr:isochorismate synthase [Marininema halotolerans]SFS94523.1 menaquinone-specific isochorismate synthase [Marininema halotolerans]